MERYDPAYVDRWLDRLEHVFGEDRYMPVRVRGWEHMPEKPALLVSNHSGGTLIPDVWGFAWAWSRRFEHKRRLSPMAHDMLFKTRASANACARLGIRQAGRGAAREVLQEGRDLLVCPGGDRDTWRPWSERYQVCFAGRKGYARLALQSGVPVTPVANVGAHETLVVLSDGHRLAERLGLKRHFRAAVFPVHLSFPWLVGVGPVPHIPWPVHMDYSIGRPVPLPAGWEPSATPPPCLVDEYDARCRRSMQGLLTELGRERDTAREAIAGLRRVGARAFPRIDRRVRQLMAG
ncbi:MAG: hypothetical protein GY884_25240 [Proteobacteria bacterium]|nr:hypothetical protein [Pseudomonadota bacterium]